MNRLIQGIQQFQRDVFPANRELFARLASGQKPEALFIACSDSRVSLEWITQCGPGDLFVCRNAGNMAPRFSRGDDVSATIEYAVSALGVRDIVVCGHSDCGAMKALLNPASLKDMPHVKSWLRNASEARLALRKAQLSQPSAETLVTLTKLNVRLQLDRLSVHPKVQTQLRAKALELHGWYYQIDTGEVEAWQAAEDRWVAVRESRHGLAIGAPQVSQVVGRA
ncbi:MAG: carbonate dehydratase [Candidatus Solibacter sp.]|nr:carbonate dehydratase [Candidatus Solibacter sp.]